MLKSGRTIVLYVLLTVIRVHSTSDDPVSLLVKLLSNNDKPLVVFMEKREPDDLVNYSTDDDNHEHNDHKQPNALMQLFDDYTDVVIEKKNPNKLTELLANLKRLKDDHEGRNDFDDLLLPAAGEDALLDDDYDEKTLEETARDHAKELFYHFLRTTPDEDSSVEDTKHFLRQALRARCTKVTTCITKCKKKKPSCPSKCQKKYDDSNLCEPPKKPKCGKPKCGWPSTMPPRWLL